MEQIPNGRAMIGSRQRVQIGERETAPRRAQKSQPRYPIRRVQQREGERHQVFHHLPLAELIDLDRLERDSMRFNALTISIKCARERTNTATLPGVSALISSITRAASRCSS
jgi:hypothetical protein